MGHILNCPCAVRARSLITEYILNCPCVVRARNLINPEYSLKLSATLEEFNWETEQTNKQAAPHVLLETSGDHTHRPVFYC